MMDENDENGHLDPMYLFKIKIFKDQVNTRFFEPNFIEKDGITALV